MKIKLIILVLICFSFAMFDVCLASTKKEINFDSAICNAKKIAKEKNYDTSNTDIELVKVKNGLEKGPIRLVWLMQFFPIENKELLFKKDFWIVYFYPKGQLEKPNILGGDFCALIDLYSGEIIDSFEGQ